ncbi:MAG TPA: cobalamin-independent methionine synthase II family protein [Trebonia sp.]|nr:cobalamin-independent methionine synthase II family protein [Trebonia sp.]
MELSTDRILTTHVGSLPRPPQMLEVLVASGSFEQSKASANPDYERRTREAVAQVVREQVQAGTDVVSDGEMGRVVFSIYATERLTGFDGEPRTWDGLIEFSMFPELFEPMLVASPVLPVCGGEVTWRGREHIQADIERFNGALQGVNPREAFMTAVSPGQIYFNSSNDFYPDEEAFVMACAEAMGNEYRAIVDAGFLLQIDAPDLAFGWGLVPFADKSLDDYRKNVEMHVEAINVALQGIPAGRVRLHVCWGNGPWPHVRDVPLAEIIDIIYRVNAQGLSVEGANGRHGHEWSVFRDHPLPDDKVLLPGVIDTVTNVVEHPDLVAERIERYAGVVGKERVIASTDCGFSSAAAAPNVHPSIVQPKLQALIEGSRRASERLWP